MHIYGILPYMCIYGRRWEYNFCCMLFQVENLTSLVKSSQDHYLIYKNSVLALLCNATHRAMLANWHGDLLKLQSDKDSKLSKTKTFRQIRVVLLTTPLLIGTVNATQRIPPMLRHVWIVNGMVFFKCPPHTFHINFVGFKKLTNYGHFNQSGKLRVLLSPPLDRATDMGYHIMVQMDSSKWQQYIEIELCMSPE